MRLPPPTISSVGGGPFKGLQSAFQQAPGDEGLMNNLGLQNRAQQGALEYYNNQNAEDFGNPLAQAVHMGQAAQATQGADPQGMHAFTQALKEREATIGKRSGLNLPDSPMGQPSTIFDPSVQTSAVDQAQPIKALKRLR